MNDNKLHHVAQQCLMSEETHSVEAQRRQFVVELDEKLERP